MALTDVATKVVELVPIAMAVGIAEKALEIPGKTAGAGKTNKSSAKKKQKKQFRGMKKQTKKKEPTHQIFTKLLKSKTNLSGQRNSALKADRPNPIKKQHPAARTGKKGGDRKRKRGN